MGHVARYGDRQSRAPRHLSDISRYVPIISILLPKTYCFVLTELHTTEKISQFLKFILLEFTP